MYRFLFTCAALCILALPHLSQAAVTPDASTNFITTWNTENPGTSADNQITIPGTGGGYSYELYWENTASSTQNGTTTLITTDSHTLTFPAPGIYEVQASGTFPRIYSNNGGDKDKILTVEQWGDIAWVSMAKSFFGASNLRVPATDAPDLSGVTDMSVMFRSASIFNESINHWDVSTIENMRLLFNNTSFNQPLNNWDTARVTDMLSVFSGATSFNQPLNEWDVSSVTTMRAMFNQTNFNQPLNNWNTASVTDMVNMFWRTPFNQDISMWDVSSVEGTGQMFRDNVAFNQPLNEWDVSKVTNMKFMFSGATAFNQPLNEWDTSSVTEFANCPTDSEERSMFYGAVSFDQDLSDWDISSATCMRDFFKNTALSQPNQDATLQSWAAQPLQPNVPFHLGLKSYSSTGAAALNTLRTTHNWTITEQYSAEYYPSANAAMLGDNIQSPLDSGATTTAVTLNANNGCVFEQWSDGDMSYPRTDVITDNLSVTAEFSCRTTSTSAKTQRDRSEQYGNQENANYIEDRFLTSTSTKSTTFTPPATLEESLEEVKNLNIKDLDPVKDRDTINQLIKVLLELIQALTMLMVGATNES
jgi:surface protein